MPDRPLKGPSPRSRPTAQPSRDSQLALRQAMAASSPRHAGMMRVLTLAILVLLLHCPCSSATFVPYGNSNFQFGFYSSSCPSAESIVTSTLLSAYNMDAKVTAQLVRLMFHECFVSGCDGSLLVNSTSSTQSEKTAGPNQSVSGYWVIDAAKAALEAACPGVVSCADIQVLIARDATILMGGPYFQVPTGRLDSRSVTTGSQAANALPAPTDSASKAARLFTARGFSVHEFVTLMGGHTVGAAFCQTFSYRLYNYQNTGQAQPNMDPNLVSRLKAICPNPNSPTSPDPRVTLDQGPKVNSLDNSYYQQLQMGHGILEIDQSIGTSSITAPFVRGYAGNGTGAAPTKPFPSSFANVFLKLGTLDVITGKPSSKGSIRQNCAILN